MFGTNNPLQFALFLRRLGAASPPWFSRLPWRRLYGLPFGVGLGWLLIQGFTNSLTLDLFHVTVAGVVGAAALLGARLWTPALATLVLLAPLLSHFAIERPRVAEALSAPPSVQQSAYVRLEGTVREREALPLGTADAGSTSRETPIRLLLGEVRLWRGVWDGALAEMEVVLPARSAWAFPPRARVRIGGIPSVLERAGGRLRLVFRRAAFHIQTPPVSAWGGEALRLRLRDRAAYYLSKSALAVYLPVLLGMRERTDPEARAVTNTFRRVGISHIFAISGLHVGLLYLIFSAVLDLGLRWGQRRQGWVYAGDLSRIVVVTLIWGYIALIGFPIPAVRAALMGTMLVWSSLWGTRTPRLYVLALAGLLLLAGTPSLVYDLSFQLSFLAYFFLISALGLWPRGLAAKALGYPARTGIFRWVLPALDGAALNVWLTLFITLGLWPLAASVFGRLSLLVFLGNLLMVPLLSVLVLPSGLAALVTSLVYLDTLPGSWPERWVFGLLERVLEGWVWLARLLDGLSGLLVFDVRLGWPAREYFIYYSGLLMFLALLRLARNRRGSPAIRPA